MFIDELEIYKDRFFFPSLHGGRYSDEENVKEVWNFQTFWNWCKMKILYSGLSGPNTSTILT